MRTASFMLVATPALLGGLYLDYQLGVWDTAGSPFPWLLVPGVLVATGLASFALNLSYKHHAPRPLSRLDASFELLAALSSLLLPALFDVVEIPLAFVLFSFLGFRLLRGSETDRMAAAVAVALDFALEALLVYKGAYRYTNALVAPLPLWLPAVWANIGVAAFRLYPLLPELPWPRRSSPRPHPAP
jgi:hypothetical protein